MARKRGVERSEEEVFLYELARHGSIRKACLVAGVTRAWLRLKKMDEDFATAYQDALEDATDLIEEAGVSQAKAGDDKLIRYLLDARRYKKTIEVDLSQVKPIINVTIGG
jgi:hypothetical protein